MPDFSPLPTDVLCAHVWTRAARRPVAKQSCRVRRWTRYERLSFSMLIMTWGILIAVVTALHLGNRHRETRTSSTSGAHTSFHGSAASLRALQQNETVNNTVGTQP